MIKEGNKIKTRVIDQGSYESMKDKDLKPGQIVEFNYKLNFIQRFFKGKIMQMKKSELSNLYDIVYYSYNEDTGKAIIQCQVKNPTEQNTLSGVGYITITVASIATAFIAYFFTKAKIIKIRNPVKSVVTGLGDWKTIAGIAGALYAISEIMKEGGK